MPARARPAYQVEPVDLAEAIWDRGHITPWELLRICAWKSAQNLALLSVNAEATIVAVTRKTVGHLAPLQNFDAFDAAPDWATWQEQVSWAIGSKDKGSGLLGFSGVGYPVATAVLCVLNPRAFPVMDKWVLQALYGSSIRPEGYHHAASYREYAEALVGRRHDGPSLASVHEVDQHLMNQQIDASGTRP